MIVCSLMTISVVSALGRETREAMAVASVSRMILPGRATRGEGADQQSAINRYVLEGSPIIDTLVRGQQHHIKSLEHAPLLDLTPQYEPHRIMERDQSGLKHELVGSCEWTDEVEG